MLGLANLIELIVPSSAQSNAGDTRFANFFSLKAQIQIIQQRKLPE